MSDEEDSGGGGEKTLQPRVVLYCGVCGLPPEYCEFGAEFDKCLPWLREHAPDVYPHLTGAEAAAQEGVQALSLNGAPGDAKGGAGQPGPVAAGSKGAEEAAAAKPEKKGKKKKDAQPEVLVEKVTRNKRKSITTIKGLETFGVKLPEAAKKLGKKFASGASVTKGPTEKEQIDVQGDIIFDIADYLAETWPEVPRTSIFLIEDGKKAPAY